MVTIQWRDAYNTGVELFDQEHHKIVELMNTMFAAILSKGEKKIFEKVCEDIIAYTEYHFAHEEKAMALVSYPGVEEHIADHKWLKQEAEKIQEVIKNNFPEGAKELYVFLRQWLVDHIQIVDKQYSSYLIGLDEAEII